MTQQQKVVCLDMEGVLTPEIWHAVAAAFDEPELRKTTRDIADYEQLMAHRIAVLEHRDISHSALVEIVHQLEPLEGAREFLDSLRQFTNLTILSDTFENLAAPLIAKLGYPHVLCHTLEVTNDKVSGVRMRMPHAKRSAVRAYQALGYSVLAAGDSYNDTQMFDIADEAVLFRATPQLIAAKICRCAYTEYEDLLLHIRQWLCADRE